MPIKVLFIGGSGRSGSTILSILLSQLKGFVSIGELTALWQRGLLENRHCSCTVPFRECPFWREVIPSHLFRSREEIESVVAVKKQLFGQPALRRLRLIIGNRLGFEQAARQWAGILEEIYGRVQEATGCTVIIDSSKQPVHGYSIGLVPSVELFVVHLVRDPRAVAFSRQRKKLRTPMGWQPEYMDRFRIAMSARKWIAENAKCEYFWDLGLDHEGYMRLRYEDFTRSPKNTIARIRDMVREDAEVDFFIESGEACLKQVTHQIEGNPVRFQARQITINQDQEWLSAMPLKDRVLTTALTWPMLIRYGYLR